MKVLAISSSPRKGGNSDVLCDRFLKGAAEAGHETEKVRLQTKKIAPCLACYKCFEGERKCCQKDDVAEILGKMMEADVIVLASPVYFYSICAQLKILIDRTMPIYQQMKNKKFYFIVTAADAQHSAANETLADFRGFLRCYEGSEELGTTFGTGTWNKGDVFDHESFNEAYEAGKALA